MTSNDSSTSTDFGVAMRREVLEHKLRDGKVGEGYCYWTFPHGIPKGAGSGSKIWVANGGRWVGYFVVHQEGDTAENELAFYSDSFREFDGGPRRPFMGYTLEVPHVV